MAHEVRERLVAEGHDSPSSRSWRRAELGLAAPRGVGAGHRGRRADRPRHRRPAGRIRLGHHPHDLGHRRRPGERARREVPAHPRARPRCAGRGDRHRRAGISASGWTPSRAASSPPAATATGSSTGSGTASASRPTRTPTWCAGNGETAGGRHGLHHRAGHLPRGTLRLPDRGHRRLRRRRARGAEPGAARAAGRRRLNRRRGIIAPRSPVGRPSKDAEHDPIPRATPLPSPNARPGQGPAAVSRTPDEPPIPPLAPGTAWSAAHSRTRRRRAVAGRRPVPVERPSRPAPQTGSPSNGPEPAPSGSSVQPAEPGSPPIPSRRPSPRARRRPHVRHSTRMRRSTRGRRPRLRSRRPPAAPAPPPGVVPPPAAPGADPERASVVSPTGPRSADAHPARGQDGASDGPIGCTAAQLRRFIK